MDNYYIYDTTNHVSSYPFEIRNCIYVNVLKQASRVFYFQRCGVSKNAAYATTAWEDTPCHIGNLQDTDCRLYNNTNISTSKDLSGGWHDAGDYNKYVNFTFEAVADLLHAYGENYTFWPDFNMIPESGDNIPDILNEVKQELDWLLKMQNSNGSVLSIVGVANYATASPPSADASQRLYGPETTSATFTAAALFSLAAIQYNTTLGIPSYALTLDTAARKAWNWAVANPGITFYNSGTIGAGEQEVGTYESFIRQMAAAVYLFAFTGDSTYKNYFDNNYLNVHLMQWTYAYPFESGSQDMMLYYASLPNATPAIAAAIKSAYQNSMQTNNADNLPAYINETDAYRAYIADNNYTWGSNTTKARQGIMFLNMITYNLNPANNLNYEAAALGYLNYLHGVNPTAFCYVSNMGNDGAENSINEFYHAWFEDGSALWDRVGTSTFGPPPGYVPGGPNPTYEVDACCPSSCAGQNALCNSNLVTPPLGQPIQKSYKDWNTGWPQNSWTVTEAGIYTQASYIRLLSHFSANCWGTLSTSEFNPDYFSVNVFPNPASNILNVNVNKEGEFLLSDILGKKLLALPLVAGENPIQLSGISAGIYLFKISNQAGDEKSGKIIVE